jgi:hypothetical protein
MFSGTLFAQNEGEPQFFVGYSNLQAEGLPEKNDPDNLFSPDFLDRRTTLHGINAEVTFPLSMLGITGDFSFNRNDRSQDVVNGSDSINTDI